MANHSTLTGTHIRACAVSRIAREDSAASAALLDLASDGRKAWTLAAWKALLAELDNSSLTIGEWLDSRADFL